MINLERLKESGLLIQGFDKFLHAWFECPPSLEKTQWDDSAVAVFSNLPEALLEFHNVIDRWPQSKIVIDNNQEHIYRPPTPRKIWSLEKKTFEVIEDHFSIVCENQGNWEVWLSTRKGDEGILFTDYDLNFKRSDLMMETPIDEFLVTFGLHELIVNNCIPDSYEVDKFADAILIFCGRYNADVQIRFYYHEDGLLWFSYGEDSPDWVAYQS